MKKAALSCALTILLLFNGIISAHAHANLVSSFPKANERLDRLPQYVEVVFGGNLLNFGKAKVNVLKVKDSSGVRLDDGNSITAGTKLKVGLLKLTISGDISVTWRVTSDDGHPVDGGYVFSVGPQGATFPYLSASVPLVPQKNFLSRYGILFLYGLVALGVFGLFATRKTRRRKGSI